MCCYISKNKAHKSSIPLRINKLLKNQKLLPCVSSFLTLSRLPGTQFPVSMINSGKGREKTRVHGDTSHYLTPISSNFKGPFYQYISFQLTQRTVTVNESNRCHNQKSGHLHDTSAVYIYISLSFTRLVDFRLWIEIEKNTQSATHHIIQMWFYSLNKLRWRSENYSFAVTYNFYNTKCKTFNLSAIKRVVVPSTRTRSVWFLRRSILPNKEDG